MFINLFRGIVIGLITGMPIGPMGAVCLKNTLCYGRICGLISGLASSIIDSLYATLAVLGLLIIEKFIIMHQLFLRIGGGMILVCFGIYNLINENTNKKGSVNSNSLDINLNLNCNHLIKAFSSTILLALANPATIFSFIAVFTGLHLANIGKSTSSKILLILGVFIGSMLWWIILILTAGKFTGKLKNNHTNIINKILNFTIIVFGVIIFLTAFSFSSIRKPFIVHEKLFKIFFNIKSRIPLYKLR